MAKSQSASLDRKKLMGDPIMVTTIVLLIVFLTVFILYPLAILLVDSFINESGVTLSTFKRVMDLANFRRAITNTL
ncbi:MAG: iron ABC transporter permease, partial [Lachnospiraceae bacterium]|nr:iron ABC transporter permease [Lachnospiraceae bacterium]